MNFKRVRKGYDPVQVEAFIKSREEQNNSIIENQQKIIDAQADEIKQLRQGKETATVGGAMLMDERRCSKSAIFFPARWICLKSLSKAG